MCMHLTLYMPEARRTPQDAPPPRTIGSKTHIVAEREIYKEERDALEDEMRKFDVT